MKQNTGNTKKNNPFKTAFRAFIGFKWAYLLFAIMFLAAGVGFIGYPKQATDGVCIAVGIVAVLFSVFAMVMCLSGKKRGVRFWAQMITTGLGIVTGIVVIILSCNDLGAAVFRVLILILAVYMIIDGSFKLQTAILSRRYRSWLWWVLLVLVIAAIGLGVFALYHGANLETLIEESLPQYNEDGEEIKAGSYIISRLVGISFIIDGILNFLSIIFLYKIEREQRNEVIRELEEEGRIAVVEDADDPAALSSATPPASLPASDD